MIVFSFVQFWQLAQQGDIQNSETGLDWDPFRGLSISGRKAPMDPHGKVTTHFRRGGPGAWPPWNVFNFGSLKRHFPHSEGTFEQNIKVLNNIFLTVYRTILKKCFCWNEIRLFALHRTQARAGKIRFCHFLFSY